MTILKVEPDKSPYSKEIGGSLKSMQSEVDGYIEAVPLFDNVVLICNEDGKLRGLPSNRQIGQDVIAGNFFLVGVKGEDFISLTADQIAKAKLLF